MNLREYYYQLPRMQCPKTEFINKLAEECKVTAATVHNWIKGRTEPNLNEYGETLSRITGIPQDELF